MNLQLILSFPRHWPCNRSIHTFIFFDIVRTKIQKYCLLDAVLNAIRSKISDKIIIKEMDCNRGFTLSRHHLAVFLQIRGISRDKNTRLASCPHFERQKAFVSSASCIVQDVALCNTYSACQSKSFTFWCCWAAQFQWPQSPGYRCRLWSGDGVLPRCGSSRSNEPSVRAPFWWSWKSPPGIFPLCCGKW